METRVPGRDGSEKETSLQLLVKIPTKANQQQPESALQFVEEYTSGLHGDNSKLVKDCGETRRDRAENAHEPHKQPLGKVLEDNAF